MITKREISYACLEAIKPKAVSSEPITIELIDFHVDNVRAQFIRNEYNKNRSVDPEVITDLGCIDLIKVDSSECCDLDLGCTFLRSNLKMPSFIELHQGPLVTRVGPINKISRPYQLIPFERVPFEFYNKFTKGLVKAFFQNNNDYLYLAIDNDNILSKTLRKINIQGVLEKPIEASTFNLCTGEACYNDDSIYPVKGWMVSSIIQEVVNKFLGPESKAFIDSSNNKRSDATPQIEGQ
jgi:hypothetical protein